MARPSYTQILSTDIDVDSPLDTDLFTALRDNVDASRVSLLFLDFAETNTTATTWSTAHTFTVHVPDVADYGSIQRKLYVRFDGKVAAGTGEYRLYDNTGSTAGSSVTTTITSYPNQIALTYDLPAATKGSDREFLIQFQHQSTSTVYARAIGRMDSYLEF